MIAIEDLARHAAAHDRASEALRDPRGPAVALARKGRPVIDGLAVTYGVDHEHPKTRVTERFAPGCFATADGTGVPVFLEHDYDCPMSLSAANLSLFDGPDGLAFRFNPPRTTQGAAAVGMVRSRNRPCVSVGYVVTKDRAEGNVRVITEARLVEMSLCKLGAVPGTFATVVDATTEPEPAPATRSAWFYTMAKIARPLHALAVAERKARAVADAVAIRGAAIERSGYGVDPEMAAGAARLALIRQCRGWG